ncbi:hypothetical protein HDV00_012445 [Rhizophlyctis rosea]|nr:hypothetical protein HDV00_012445 [Rhizophlyctis rosea]
MDSQTEDRRSSTPASRPTSYQSATVSETSSSKNANRLTGDSGIGPEDENTVRHLAADKRTSNGSSVGSRKSVGANGEVIETVFNEDGEPTPVVVAHKRGTPPQPIDVKRRTRTVDRLLAELETAIQGFEDVRLSTASGASSSTSPDASSSVAGLTPPYSANGMPIPGSQPAFLMTDPVRRPATAEPKIGEQQYGQRRPPSFGSMPPTPVTPGSAPENNGFYAPPAQFGDLVEYAPDSVFVLSNSPQCLRMGFLFKWSPSRVHGGWSWTRRYVIIAEGAIHVYRSNAEQERPIGRMRLIPTTSVRISENGTSAIEVKNEVEYDPMNPSAGPQIRAWHLQCAGHEDMMEWLAAIEHVIHQAGVQAGVQPMSPTRGRANSASHSQPPAGLQRSHSVRSNPDSSRPQYFRASQDAPPLPIQQALADLPPPPSHQSFVPPPSQQQQQPPQSQQQQPSSQKPLKTKTSVKKNDHSHSLSTASIFFDSPAAAAAAAAMPPPGGMAGMPSTSPSGHSHHTSSGFDKGDNIFAASAALKAEEEEKRKMMEQIMKERKKLMRAVKGI